MSIMLTYCFVMYYRHIYLKNKLDTYKKYEQFLMQVVSILPEGEFSSTLVIMDGLYIIPCVKY